MSVLWASIASLAMAEPMLEPSHRRHPNMKLLKMVEPIYPGEALCSGIDGTVVVEVLIDKHGVPQAIHALRGNPVLATRAYKAVRQWRWKPYRLNRVPIAVELTIAMNFGPEPGSDADQPI